MSNLFSLEGKVIVVTGGAGYLGSAMVKELLEHGGTVVVDDIAMKSAEEIVGTCDLAKNLHILHYNLENTAEIVEMFNETKKRCGRIDVLVNCAAYGGGAGGKPVVGKTVGNVIEQITDDVWRRGIDGTIDVSFRCTREVLPFFYENGKGNIINIASMYGVVSPDPRIYGTSGQNSPPPYGTGKAAVLQFTRYCAAHLASKNIRVNAVTPGPFPNPKGLVGDEFKKKLEDKTMLGRVGVPRDIAGAIVLLASEASAFMTGSNITVDGGWTAW